MGIHLQDPESAQDFATREVLIIRGLLQLKLLLVLEWAINETLNDLKRCPLRFKCDGVIITRSKLDLRVIKGKGNLKNY